MSGRASGIFRRRAVRAALANALGGLVAQARAGLGICPLTFVGEANRASAITGVGPTACVISLKRDRMKTALKFVEFGEFLARSVFSCCPDNRWKNVR